LFYIFKGSAGNGKSLIANTLFQRAFGDYYGTPPSSLFAKVGETRGSDNPDPPNSGLANIEGKRVLVVSEPPTNAKSNKVSLNEPTIKMITGHDPITARRLHKDYAKQPFVCSAHSILLLNDDVQFRPTPSLERRVRILEFPSQFKSQEDYDRIRGTDEEKASQGIYVRDDTLSRKFATLPYAIEFMRMVLSMAVVTEDFYNEDFKELPNVLEASRQAFIGQDYVADFVATYFEQTTDEDEGITNALLEDLHARYRKDKRIAPSNAVGSLELSTTLKNFHGAIPVKKRNLMDRGFKIQHENVRGLRGIKLKEQYSQPQEPVLAVEQKQMLNMTEMFQAFLQAQAQARPQEQVPAQVPARRLSPKVPSVNPRNV
jgi:phage/plasmid-associated DNA primase